MNREPLTTRWMQFCGKTQLILKSLTLTVFGLAFLFGKIRDVPSGPVSVVCGLAILVAATLRLLIDFGRIDVHWNRYFWIILLLSLLVAAIVSKPG